MKVLAVIAPAESWRTNRGFRHAVVPGESRALCGKNVENWQGDLKTLDAVEFSEASIGCHICIRCARAQSVKR